MSIRLGCRFHCFDLYMERCIQIVLPESSGLSPKYVYWVYLKNLMIVFDWFMKYRKSVDGFCDKILSMERWYVWFWDLTKNKSKWRNVVEKWIQKWRKIGVKRRGGIGSFGVTFTFRSPLLLMFLSQKPSCMLVCASLLLEKTIHEMTFIVQKF